MRGADSYRVERHGAYKGGVPPLAPGGGIAFPPAQAPAVFQRAWRQATRGLSESDIAAYGVSMFLGMHNLPELGQAMQPRLPVRALESYRQVARDYLALLARYRTQLSAVEYTREKMFFIRLLRALAQAARGARAIRGAGRLRAGFVI